MGFNVIGELPGTTKADEIVMVGGHFDSWQGGTGATENGTGSAVAMEAVRILASLHQPMARTVRVALWGAEEEGLYGSLAYVQQHFAPRDTMKKTPESTSWMCTSTTTPAPANFAAFRRWAMHSLPPSSSRGSHPSKTWALRLSWA